ncbi:hypothetical protein DXG01_011280 [Tephrocybe rancida]|nr:hypothetical protein DXG01_011280 [Tephrocybe rancida]
MTSLPSESLFDIIHQAIEVDSDANQVRDLLDALLAHPSTHRKTSEWARATTMKTYTSEVALLSCQDRGLHYMAGGISEEKLRSFDINDISQTMSAHAPCMWDLIDNLLVADPELKMRREKWRGQKLQRKRAAKAGKDSTSTVANEEIGPEERSWDFLDQNVPIVDQEDDTPEDIVDQDEQREMSLKTIKKIVCMSVLLQSTNMRCNALQTIVGVFLQSCNTPETVREFLAHAGLSVSASSINNAISSLSKESENQIRKTGQTLMAAYAYDNLDIDLKHSVPTLEKGQETLVHLTTGTMLPLHDVPPDALNCSDEMWEKSEFNPDAPRVPPVTMKQLTELYPEVTHPSGLRP